MSKIETTILFLILILALFLRLYKIKSPIADWHSWRQADTSAVTRNFIKYGIDPLRPRFDDLSNIPSGQDNPQGYRMVEFPIYNLIHYEIYKINIGFCSMFHVPCLPLEAAGRLTTIISSLFSLIFLYLIVKHFSNTTMALLSAFIYAVLPYNIYYSRVILPDPMMVTFSLGAVWFFILSLYQNKPTSLLPTVFFLLSSIMAASASLIKPTAIFFLILIGYLAFRKWGLKTLKQPQFYLYWIIIIIPFVLWRLWVRQFPEGIPAYTWLLNGDGIRLRPAWFRWLFYERLTKLILGGFGLVLFVIGII